MKNNNNFTKMGHDTNKLLNEQIGEWELCGLNYGNLSNVQVRRFDYEQAEIKVQWNPARMTSTSAKVDQKSIKERPCFLCGANRPTEQRGIDICRDYVILVNPFPIFPQHFTITNKEHVPQKIDGNFGRMLEISRDLGGQYLVFYNGPRCGASAPDHMHFQAGNTGFLPLEDQLRDIRNKRGPDAVSGSAGVWFIDDSLRKMIMLEGIDLLDVAAAFSTVYSSLQTARGSNEEPMMNLISYFLPETGKVSVVVFIREKHRPACYFAEGENGLLLSPAAVDIGGVCVTPREADFNKITNTQIQNIFSEVFVDADFFGRLKSDVIKRLS